MTTSQYISKNNTYISIGLMVAVAITMFYAGSKLATVETTLQKQGEDIVEIKDDVKDNGDKIESVKDDLIEFFKND